MRKLFDAALVAPAGEISVEKSENAGPGHVAANEASAERQYVGVVMLTGELGREGIVDTRAAAFRFAIDGYRNADSGTADGDPPVGITRCNRRGEASAISRIIDAFRPVCTEVGYFMALLAQPADELVFEQITSMVGGQGNAHGN